MELIAAFACIALLGAFWGVHMLRTQEAILVAHRELQRAFLATRVPGLPFAQVEEPGRVQGTLVDPEQVAFEDEQLG